MNSNFIQDQDIAIPFSWPYDDDSQTLVSQVDVKTSQLKPEFKYGVFLWWSEQSPSWIHPDDIEIANELVPGNRMFCREECENFADRQLGYWEYSYGEENFRGLPALWMEIKSEGYQLGDVVEIKSQNGKLPHGIATIREIKWNRKSRSIEYYLSDDRAFRFNDIQPAYRLGQHFSPRELELSAKHRIR